MKLKLKGGTTSRIIRVFIQDTSKPDGSGLSGLVNITSNLKCYYSRVGDPGATAVTLGTAIVGTWASGGFVAVDGTNLPGVYEIGVPNAVLASGSTAVHLMLYGASNMAPVVCELELDAVDYQDATAFGLARIDANIGSRLATSAYNTPPSTSAIAAAVLTDTADVTTVGSIGYLIAQYLDAKVSTRSTYNGGPVASVTAPVSVNAVNGQAPPANWSNLAITSAGGVTAGIVSDKSGYSLASAQSFSTTGNVGNVTGSVGSVGNPVSVSGSVTVGGYIVGQDPGALVLDAPASSHRNPNTIGALFTASGLAGSDPWAAALPGNYAPGTAGAILGGNLDAQISAIKVKTDNLPSRFPANFPSLAVDAASGGVTVTTNQDKNGYVLGAAGLDAIQVEAGINARQALSPILAASAGVVSGAGTGNVQIKGANSSVTRITATTDKLGNRTVVTLALPPATIGGVMSTASYYFPSAYFPQSFFPIGKAIQPS